MEILIPTKCIALKLSWIQYRYKTSRLVYIFNLDLIIFKILINRESCLFTKSLIIRRDANSAFQSLQDLFYPRSNQRSPRGCICMGPEIDADRRGRSSATLSSTPRH